MPSVDPDTTLGPILVGHIFAIFLFGVSTFQVILFGFR